MNPTSKLIVECFLDSDCCVIFFSPLKNISGQKFSHFAPPYWYHKKTSVPNVGHTVGKGSNALEWAPEDGGLAPKAIWLLHIIFYSPLKNMSERKFSHAAPPRWYHKQTSISDVGLTVGKGSIALEWALEDRGRRWKPIWLSSFFSDSPLKNMIDGNLVFPRPPQWYHKQTSVPDVGLVGKGSIASEWALEEVRRPESQFDCWVFFRILPLKIWWTEI
jgi:hypothetical protein